MNEHDADVLLREAFAARLDDAPEAPARVRLRVLQALGEPAAASHARWSATAWAAPARWAAACAIVTIGGAAMFAHVHPPPSAPSLDATYPVADTVAHRPVPQKPNIATRPIDQMYEAPAVHNGDAAIKRSVVPAPTAAPGRTQPVNAPALARTGDMTIVVRDAGAALRDVRTVTARESGYVTAMNDTLPATPGGVRDASATIVVPAAKLDETMDAVAALGTVRARSTAAEDLAPSIVDGAARLRNLRREETDLRRIMDRSGKAGEILEVETHLSDVRGQIETLDAQLQSMRNRVATSTLHVSIAEDRPAHAFVPPSAGGRIATMWSSALRGAADFALALTGVILWTTAFAPFWIAAGIAGALAAHRLRARRAAKRT